MSKIRATSIRSLWMASAFSLLFAVPYAAHAATIDGPLDAATGIDDIQLSDGNYYDVTFQNVSFAFASNPAGVERDPGSLGDINTVLTAAGVTGLSSGGGIFGNLRVPQGESQAGAEFTLDSSSDFLNGGVWTLSSTVQGTTVHRDSESLFVATVQPVPLPGSMVLLISGLGAVLFMRKRRGRDAPAAAARFEAA